MVGVLLFEFVMLCVVDGYVLCGYVWCYWGGGVVWLVMVINCVMLVCCDYYFCFVVWLFV